MSEGFFCHHCSTFVGGRSCGCPGEQDVIRQRQERERRAERDRILLLEHKARLYDAAALHNPQETNQ